MTIIPNIRAVVALSNDVMGSAGDLFKDPTLNLHKLSDFLRKFSVAGDGNRCLGRVDDPSRPMIIKDEHGVDTMYQVWGHPRDPLNPEFSVVLISKRTKDSRNEDVFKPEILLRGPKANVLIVGGMSCCGGALQAHWTQTRGEGQAPIDAARVPTSGHFHDEHRNWLQGKVHVADGEQGLNAIRHLITDVLAHRFPDDPRFKHNCGSQTNYKAYSTAAKSHTLG